MKPITWITDGVDKIETEHEHGNETYIQVLMDFGTREVRLVGCDDDWILIDQDIASEDEAKRIGERVLLAIWGDEPLCAAGPWEPIADAPRDGTECLLKLKGDAGCVVRSWDKKYMIWADHDMDDITYNDQMATHFAKINTKEA